MKSYNKYKLLSEGVSLEDINDPLSGEQVDQVLANVEECRKEVECDVEQVRTTVGGIDQLEQQNDAIREIVKDEGEFTAATAEGFRLARRAVVSNLGLDPDSGAGKAIVDVPGLESLVVNPSLEAADKETVVNKRMIERLKDFIKTMFEKLAKAFRKFKAWLTSLFVRLPEMAKKAYMNLSALSDKEFDERLETLSHNRNYSERYIEPLVIDGKMLNMNDIIKTQDNYIDKTIDNSIYQKFIGRLNEDGAQAHAGDQKSENLTSVYLIALGKHLLGTKVESPYRTAEVVLRDDHTPALFVKVREFSGYKPFKKHDLLNTMKVSKDAMAKCMKLEKDAENEQQKFVNLVKTVTKLDPGMHKYVYKMLVFAQHNYSQILTFFSDNCKAYRNIIKLAEDIVKGPKLEKVSTSKELVTV